MVASSCRPLTSSANLLFTGLPAHRPCGTLIPPPLAEYPSDFGSACTSILLGFCRLLGAWALTRPLKRSSLITPLDGQEDVRFPFRVESGALGVE